MAALPLRSLGLLQAMHILLVPFEETGGKLGAKDAIQRVVFCSEAAVKASHKMEAVQAHCRPPWVEEFDH